MKKKFRLLVMIAMILAFAAPVIQVGVVGQVSGPPNKILAHALDVELGRAQPARYEQHLSSGALYTLLEASGELENRLAAAPASGAASNPVSDKFTQGCQNVFTGPKGTHNVRVNQDCSLRRQAEEVIAINPTNPDNLIAGQNDSRIGFNHCGYDWSFDGGKTWGDQIPPFYQFVLSDGHTADACSDPTASFDAQGNAYIGGVLFDINSVASAFVVAKSNTGIGGAFYHTPKSSLSYQTYRDTPLGVIANDNDPNVFNDKEFIVADSNPGSPKVNHVYATWTRFANTGVGVGGDSPIYFSQSLDGGATWSPGVEISGANPALCTVFSGESNLNACDQDQGSDPVVGPDGTIYVSFGNGNTPLLGVNQALLVSCPPSADCSKSSSWTVPSKVGDLIDNAPLGPSAAGCTGGRECLPPNGYRLDEFVTVSTSVDQNSTLYVVWADFRNGGAPCTGPAATATPPCNNDVFYAFSTDRGATWSQTTNLTPASSFNQTAQWQPWSAVTQDGKTLWVAYYDRSYGDCETSGCNDITLAQVSAPASSSPDVNYTRLTTSSMPNLTPANNPLQAGFLGDYMWLAVGPDGRPHVVWADTRGLNGTVEEDIYSAVGPKP